MLQVPFVTRSVTAALDGAWLPPVQVAAGAPGAFAEAFHFVRIDGIQRVVATGRDPEPLRCGSVVHDIFTCSHEPYIYSLPDAGPDLATWTTWTRRTQLCVPYEDWNRFMHATGFLSDWRADDGFFYLSYSGSTDGDSFALRGHGKLGLARSRDLGTGACPGICGTDAASGRSRGFGAARRRRPG